jgi:hypothetical protein
MALIVQDAAAQCEIRNRLYPDGSMMYYIEPVNFYFSAEKSLRGGIATDKESYYLELLPVPFPVKPEGNKLKDDLDMKLSDGKWYKIENFDTRYTRKDTALKMIYLIRKDFLTKFRDLEVSEVKINMGDKEGSRSYVFKLHKSALKEQLDCFSKEKDRKQEK